MGRWYREIQIEGISIGDNALEFYSKETLDKNTDFYPRSRKIFRTTIGLNNNEFSSLQLHIKKENNEYIIVAVAGLIYFKQNDPQEKCIQKRSEIVDAISATLNNTKKSEIEKDFEPQDKTKKSYGEFIFFDFKDDYSEYVKVGCVFYEKNSLKKDDNHLISLTSRNLLLIKEAKYKDKIKIFG